MERPYLSVVPIWLSGGITRAYKVGHPFWNGIYGDLPKENGDLN